MRRQGRISSYEDWEEAVHQRVKAEPIWAFVGYRKSLFLHDLAWEDCATLLRDERGQAIAQQLIRAVGSISANVEEGHGRGYGNERNWFFRVAIGTARESKGWYWRGRSLLSAEALDHRLALLDEIISLLIAELSYQRQRQR